jgi:hypothetical protein
MSFDSPLPDWHISNPDQTPFEKEEEEEDEDNDDDYDDGEDDNYEHRIGF